MTAAQINAELERQLRAHVRAGKDLRRFRFAFPDNIDVAPPAAKANNTPAANSVPPANSGPAAKAPVIDADLARRIAKLQSYVKGLATRVGVPATPTVSELATERSRLRAERALVLEEAKRLREKSKKPSLLERARGVKSTGQSAAAKWALSMAESREQRAGEIDRRLQEIEQILKVKAAKLRAPAKQLTAHELAQLQAFRGRLKGAELAAGRVKAAIVASSHPAVRKERQARLKLVEAEVDGYRQKIAKLTGGEGA
jgi:hypothetical protein